MTSVGDRITRYRIQAGLSLTGLARRSGVSKGYLWSLENPEKVKAAQPRPGAETLRKLAVVLGVSVADLAGEQAADAPEINDALIKFAAEDRLPQVDVDMLASIHWRGQQPQTVARWRYIYQAIVMSRALDEGS